MKLLQVLVAALVMAAMVTPAIAEDRLELAGSMQVRGFFADVDESFTENGVTVDGDENGSHAWNDQRLRVGGKIAVAEGVSVNFRFDASESDENSSNDVAWGGSNVTGYKPYSHRRADIQFDKAYLQVEKNGFTLAAGQMYFAGFGTGRLLDAVGTGFSLSYGGLALHHIKQYDENNGNDSFNTNADVANDRSLTAAKYVFKGEGFSVTPMASYVTGDLVSNVDSDRLGLGVYVTATAGPVAFKGEVDYFDGKAGAFDEKGLQFYLDASMAATDTLRVGLQGFYAQGQDGNDVQVSTQSMPVFADWHPESYGYWSGDFPAEFNIYDPAGFGTGVIAGQVYADLKASDDLAFKFAGMYFQNEDDSIADYDGFALNAGFAYSLAKNTTFTTHVNYIDASGDDVDIDLTYTQVISGLVVSF